jgi:ribosome-associated heat shock protein Hsp15
MKSDTENDPIRLDKWLWAARFYKTRTLARQMIEGGKVHYNHQRVKPSKEVALDACIRLRQGEEEKTIIVTGLSDRRGNATDAAQLYQETPESRAARTELAERKKCLGQHNAPEHRPNKKQRRQIIRFNQPT